MTLPSRHIPHDSGLIQWTRGGSQAPEIHFKQMLHLYRKVEASRGTLSGTSTRAAAGKLADKTADEGLYATLIDLGQLYSFMRKKDNTLQLYQEALDEVRCDIAHASIFQLQMLLSSILSAMGQLYIIQYNSQITNLAEGDKGKCTVAKVLLEEAISILRTHSQDGMAADTLTVLPSTHSNLEMYNGARSTLTEALYFSCRCHGEESTRVASCHQRMASICQQQAQAIIEQVGMHMEYMLTNSSGLYHAQGSRVLVEGLQKKPEFNGIEGVVVEMDALRESSECPLLSARAPNLRLRQIGVLATSSGGGAF